MYKYSFQLVRKLPEDRINKKSGKARLSIKYFKRHFRNSTV